MTQGQGDGGGQAPEAAPEGASFEAAHAALRADPRYQFTPTDPPPLPPPPESGDWSLSPRLRAILEGLGDVLEVVFWIGVAGLGALALFLLGRAVLAAIQRRRTRPVPEAPAPYVPAAATARTLLEDAARLAKEGRYGEAVRLILRRSIEDMERQRPGVVRDAMTSREIGRLSILGEAARAGFGRIAALVERAAFAGRPVSEAEYEEARGLYAQLARGAS